MEFGRSSLAVASLLTILAAANTGWADPITYDFSGTLDRSFNGIDTVTGQFTMDTSTASISAFDFTTPFSEITSADYTAYVFSYSVAAGTALYKDYVLLEFAGPFPTSDILNLWFQTPLSPFDGSSLFIGPPSGVLPPLDSGESYVACQIDFTGTVCPDGEGSSRFTAGSAVAATPEPSSLFLLGTGLLSMLGASRRKWHR